MNLSHQFIHVGSTGSTVLFAQITLSSQTLAIFVAPTSTTITMVHKKQVQRRSISGNCPPPPRTVFLPLGYSDTSDTSESEASDSEASDSDSSERERRRRRSRSNSRHRGGGGGGGGGGGSLAESKDDGEPYYTGDTTFSTAFVLAEVVPTLVRDAGGEYYSFPTTDGCEFIIPCDASFTTIEDALNEHVPPDCVEDLALNIGLCMASHPIAELRGLELTTVAAPGVFVIDTTTGLRREEVTMFKLGEVCAVGNGADDADDDDAGSDPRRTSFVVSLYVLAGGEEYAARVYFEEVESLRALMTPWDFQRLLESNPDHRTDSPQ